MQIGLSIEERRAQFLRRYPEKQIGTTKYRSIYQAHHIRKKKIRITKLVDDTLKRRIKSETKFMAD